MSTSLLEHSAAALILSISTVLFLWIFIGNPQPLLSKLPYPPGPVPAGAISGNRNQIKSTPRVWRKYKEWAEQYGDIVYLRSYSQPIIILNSFEDVVELLEKRSGNYSSRSVSPMYKLMGFNTNTAIMEYGPGWRKHRRIFQQSFKHDSSLEYRPIQTRKMYDMLYGLLDTPDDFETHIKTFAGAIILSVMYGYDVKPKDDYFVKLVESTRPAFGIGLSPKWLVNSFPALRHIPSWFPGASFKQYASSINRKIVETQEATYKYAMTTSGSSGNAHKAIVCNLSDTYTSPKELAILKQAAASGYGAGVGTTQGTITIFIEAMILYPEVQKRAQEEVDRVTRCKRLPEYEDQDSMPYIKALVREVVRWKPLLPLGLAHANNKSDMYKGYFIPKDSIIHANVWSMTRDSMKYRDPESFNPERFLTAEGTLNDDDMIYAFGFGRRICPGRHLGLATVWLSAASILASFNLGRKRDASGNEIPLDVKYMEYGVTCYPLPFECSITPRSEEAKQLILEKHQQG